MTSINRHEIVAALPMSLEPNTLYFVNSAGNHRVVTTDENADIIEYLEVNRDGSYLSDFNKYYWENAIVTPVVVIPAITDATPTVTVSCTLTGVTDFNNCWMAFVGNTIENELQAKCAGPSISPAGVISAHSHYITRAWFKLSKDYSTGARHYYMQNPINDPAKMYGYGYSDLGLIFDSYSLGPIFSVATHNDRIRFITGWLEFSEPDTMVIKMVFNKTSSGTSIARNAYFIVLPT